MKSEGLLISTTNKDFKLAKNVGPEALATVEQGRL